MRVLIFVLLGFAVVAVPAYAAFQWIVGTTVVQLGTLFAEKQVLYDRYRGQEALTREVSLAEALAGSQSIRDWARNETDRTLMRRGIAELEHFRQSFVDKSYFFVIGASGNYYFNDASNGYAGDQFRYTLDPNTPTDAWYYATLKAGPGCHLNADSNANLRTTKVWMNCVIREGGDVLGILGTGIDLTAFVQEVVNVPQVGVTSMFVDRQGVVRAHRDQSLIDLPSVTQELAGQSTVFNLLDRAGDRQALRGLMNEVAAGGALVGSRFMQMGGKEMLVGVGYLDKLGWFNITLMDIDTIIDKRLFAPIGLLLAAVAGLVAALMALVFKRQVLDRLRRLEDVVRSARTGDYGPALRMGDQRQDEVGRLSAAFTEMAVVVSDNTRALEVRVQERTLELEQLVFRDGQTGIANRRGFMAEFGAAGATQRHGLIMVDIDHFKAINDNFGHAAGDAVVIEIARRIAIAVGSDNVCARWGGDEFIILLRDSAPHLLRTSAFAVIAGISERAVDLPEGRAVIVTASLGACLVEPGDSIETATEMADAALYIAKGEGRNKVSILDRESAWNLAPKAALHQ